MARTLMGALDFANPRVYVAISFSPGRSASGDGLKELNELTVKEAADPSFDHIDPRSTGSGLLWPS